MHTLAPVAPLAADAWSLVCEVESPWSGLISRSPQRRDFLAVWTATVLGLLYVLYKRFRKNEKAQEPQLARVRKKATKPSRAEKVGR